MSKRSTFGLALAVVLLLATAFFLVERQTRPTPAPDALPALTKPSAAPSQPTFTVDQTPSTSEATSATTTPLVGDKRISAQGDSPFSPDNPLPSVDELLAEDTEDLPAIARKLSYLVALPGLPLEERENALAHAMNLAAGNESKIIDPLVTKPDVPDSLAEVILSEALNRSLSEQADLYLSALAHRKSEAMQTLIREHLAFLTDSADLGSDPAAWQAAVANAKKAWEN
jgi:hypothetical protein